MRRYLLTSVVLVVEHDTLLQVYLGLLVCVVSLVLVARHAPYANPLCGRVQLLCLTQLTFTYMSGMLFFDGGGGAASEEGRWGALLVAVNVLAFVLLGAGLFRAVGGAVGDTQAELQRSREEEERLRATLEAMRATLAEPPDALRRARIDMEALTIEAKLGGGAFGDVHAATWRGTPVAVKTMHAHHKGEVSRAEAFRDEVRCPLPLLRALYS